MLRESSSHTILYGAMLCIMILFGTIAFYAIYESSVSEKEALKNGIQSTVEVIDKNKRVSHVLVSGVVVPRTHYSLKIHIHGESRTIKVGSRRYNDTSIGDKINVMLNEKTLVILEDDQVNAENIEDTSNNNTNEK